MIKKLAFNALCNVNIKNIVELHEGALIVICEDKWELINDLSFFKSLGNLTKHKFIINQELRVILNYEDRQLILHLYNEDEINLRNIGPYHKIY